MKPSSKKILVAFAIALSVMVFAAMAYFVFIPKKEIVAENKSVAVTPQLNSFQGVLVGTLHDAKEDVVKIGEKIGEADSNPFANTRTDPPKTTSAETSGENIFSFAILGDTQYFDAGNPQGNFQKAMANITKSNPDLVLAVGDLIGDCDGDDKCATRYSDWKKIVGSLLPKTYATQGNHDRTGDDKTDNVWRSSFNFPTNGPSGFSEQVYSFDHENSHFVILDSDKPKEHLVNGEERSWLEKDLSVNKKENTFVFFHEPAYPVGSKIMESLDKEPAERNALWEILDRHNVTAVFNGHEHIVSRRKIGGVYQFVFGNTNSFNHVMLKSGVIEYASQIQGSSGLVKVNGKGITVETHGPDGSLLDTFTFSK